VRFSPTSRTWRWYHATTSTTTTRSIPVLTLVALRVLGAAAILSGATVSSRMVSVLRH
jgi:hypothetical protein